jgi:membrane associated rhomboid family serine protease
MPVASPWGFGGTPRLGAAVRALLIANVAAFVVQVLADRFTHGGVTLIFGLSRVLLLRGAVWQLVTYTFLHGSLLHLLVNMLLVGFFGREMEDELGTPRLFALYFGCGVLAGAGWVLVSGGRGLCIGASGAALGLLGAFAAVFPRRQVTLLLFWIIPVTLSARMLAVLLGLGDLLLLIQGAGGIAYAAHLAGGIAGYVYGFRWVRRGGGFGLPPPPLSFLGLRNAAAAWRRRRLRVTRPPGGRVNADAEEIDRILDKITREGLDSLTRGERDALDAASRGGRRT